MATQQSIDITDLESTINSLKTSVDFYLDVFFQEPDIQKNVDRLIILQDIIERITNELHKDYYLALDAYFESRKAVA